MIPGHEPDCVSLDRKDIPNNPWTLDVAKEPGAPDTVPKDLSDNSMQIYAQMLTGRQCTPLVGSKATVLDESRTRCRITLIS